MTGHRATAALLLLALLGPTFALGMTLLVHRSGAMAGDSWAHSRLTTLWILGLVWAAVCLVGAYLQEKRDE